MMCGGEEDCKQYIPFLPVSVSIFLYAVVLPKAELFLWVNYSFNIHKSNNKLFVPSQAYVSGLRGGK